MSKKIIVKATQEKITKLTIAIKLSGELGNRTLLGTRLIEATMAKLPEALVEKLSHAVLVDGNFLCHLAWNEMEDLHRSSTNAERVRFLLRIYFSIFAGYVDREIWHSGQLYHIRDPWQMNLSAHRILAESYVEIISSKP